jgi:hypothetical protein
VLKGWGTATVDGRRAPAEWDRAAERVFPVDFSDGQHPATVYVMNDATQLYVALEIDQPALGPSETADLHFDNNHDGDAETGEDILRLSPPGSTAYPRGGAVDMYYDAQTKQIEPDTGDGGTNELRGAVANDGTKTFFEFAHPLDTRDDSHDFSLSAHAHAGFSVSVSDCFCLNERLSGWPPPGPWADIAIAGALPAVRLTASKAHFRWRQGLLEGSSVSFAGATTDGGDLFAELLPRRGDTPFVSAAVTASVGPFSGALDLPETLLPGGYLLRISGTSDGFPLEPQSLPLTLTAPKEGIVRQVEFSESPKGAAVTSLPAGASGLFARFHYAVRPKTTCARKPILEPITQSGGKVTRKRVVKVVCRPSITISWIGPGGARLAAVQRKNAPVLTGGFTTSPIASGIWTAVLRVGTVIAKTASIQVG